ncbi:MAG: hypothetical protein H0V17_13265 [Deltaproteobacteria bacterium]|nr:hypothetical protein [Deltaproteobacteria bacterium]
MRVFCTTILLLGTGCLGDDNRPQIDDPLVPEMDGIGEFGELVPVHGVHRVAAVCDQRAWDILPDTKHLDVAVVQTSTGASVFGVPKAGGAVRGFRVDQRGDAFDRDVTTIRDDRNYTAVSASVAAGRLVVASVVDDKIAIDIVRDDLGAVHGLGDVSGSLATDVPMITSRDQQVALVGGPFGVFANGFTGATWATTGETAVTKSSITSLTSTKYLDDAVFAWSTDTKECNLQHFATGSTSTRKFGCEGARISMNETDARGMLVFEEAGNVFRSNIYLGGGDELQVKVPVAEIARSPRVVFDGTYHWVSYIDARGDVVVGFVDERGNLVSRALEGTAPAENDAYDLAVFANGVWVVGVNDDGFGAQRMCIQDKLDQ